MSINFFMKRFFAVSFLLLFLLSFTGSAQLLTSKSLPAFRSGIWIVQQFNKDILKVTFRPDNYSHNENLSDAVILPPAFSASIKKVESADQSAKIKLQDAMINITGSSIIISNQNVLLEAAYQAAGEYQGYDIRLTRNEKIFGGGERAIPLDRRGYRFNLYNGPAYGYGEGAENLNYSVPFITSSRKYALFFDNVAKGYLDIGKSNSSVLQYGTYAGDLTFYLITGSDYPEILKSFHQLTGTQPLPPRWALGTFMSRFGYTSEMQTREIYYKMMKDSIPFDAVIFDLFWFGDSIKRTLGNLDWVNSQKWPEPQKMIADFKSDNVQTILITEPFILEGTRTYDEFKPYLCVDSSGKLFTLDKFYFGKGGLIDLFQKDAQSLFWKYYKKQMDIGVEGWWGDLGEPENHPSSLYHKLNDFGYNRLFSADEVHNIYGHYWTRMLYDQFTIQYPEKRLFSLNRSGFAGTQRYCIFPWSGDVSRSWSGLRAQLPVMLGMSMSGVPYVHADAGGFAGGEGDNELYVRWLQFALYTPVFRPHGTALYEVDTLAASYPSEIALIDQPYREIAKQVAIQRYRMMPYNYTLSYLQASDAQPLVSPLYYYFSNDTTAYKATDEFMWGQNILVAPVLQKGATNRNVYLPEGNWYRMNGTDLIQGGTRIMEPVALEQIPAYVKAGSLLPFLPENKQIMNSASYSTAEITWHYYASASPGQAILFDDDGTSKNSIEEKQYEVITASSTMNGNGYQIEFKSNGGTFNGAPKERIFHLILHGIPADATVQHANDILVKKDIAASGNAELTFTFTGKKTVIKIIPQD